MQRPGGNNFPRPGGLPAAWRLAQDDHSAAVYLDVTAAREITQHPADHLARGAHSLPDLRMRQALGNPLSVALLGKRDKDWLVAHFKEPKKLVEGSKMPPFKFLPDAELQAMSDYLLAVP